MSGTQLSEKAELYINKILQRDVPYEVQILNCNFLITNHSVYPSGKLTTLFLQYLLDCDLIKNKRIADVGAGCFALGITAVKNGAQSAVGVDVAPEAVRAAQENIERNQVKDKAFIFQGEGVGPLLPAYQNKIDVLLSGAPWDTISQASFDEIPQEMQPLYRAFYDVEDGLILDISQKGPKLLAQGGKIFITACLRVMPRIQSLLLKNQCSYQIVLAEDIHQDGDIHYVLQIKCK